MVLKYLEEAELKELKGDLKSVIVPHAGYIYSGPLEWPGGDQSAVGPALAIRLRCVG